MESALDYWTAKALLDWQVEMGVDEAIQDAPINRYDLPDKPPKATASPQAPAPRDPASAPAAPAAAPGPEDAVAAARQAARAAQDLDGLRAALAAYEHCDLKAGARNLVFADGIAGAPVMILGEAPGRDEDREGRPFVGRAGQLLDKMLAAIDMGRAREDAPVYISNVLPWRPPQNRTPEKAEIAMMLPFVERHIQLAAPKLLVLMGNTPCQALLGRSGITRMRGQWAEALALPVLPMFHPAYLLRTPAAKREAWADLLALKAKLKELA
ncbi:uracil-DNA glycosylase [Salibaculum griseiflavum]|uniref:Type-4 uracil-DNA glycosylase n=1 Tax=Salibaculum griseiflavum TaxID=1914409 RepID=A0A2V1P2I8_9RHOB|nr:uracil-DNA glycosylase [Salibaculum griseiflavum]PWG16516.1 uracil-DNA glycosylase [Salibaculum griseiflavum]